MSTKRDSAIRSQGVRTMKKPKFRVGQRVRLLRTTEVYKIKDKFWDSQYGLRGGACRDAAWDEREQPDADSIVRKFRAKQQKSKGGDAQ